MPIKLSINKFIYTFQKLKARQYMVILIKIFYFSLFDVRLRCTIIFFSIPRSALYLVPHPSFRFN